MTMQLKDLPENIKSGSMQVGLCASVVRQGPYGRHFKRPLDLLAVVLSSVVVVPVVLLLALLVMLDGQNPFYASDRVGKGGRIFRMLKLRTMVNDAEKRLEGYLTQNPEARAEWDQTQKLKYDPRVTMLGRFLRKSSLDELPQLWNVLTGDMSLVGPRPMMPDQRLIYPGHAYYALRPGLTGLWQISDRNNCTFAKRAEFDTEYEQCVSLRTDVVVLFKTIGAVAHGTGY
jgi:exopolysaccharide production protein ExoY